ncbi:MAG: hypothetical protein GWO24_02940, partial [Akkermansiaceae bacterium]|nr:hypothetical protein [Akkermansiaceae bacterium]
LLVSGTNVLAIHGMNATLNLSDEEFILAAELEATVSSLPFLNSVAVISSADERSTGDDPDGDGQDNLLEHAAGTDPTVAGIPAA